MPHISRFKKRVSDRSGFNFFELGLVKQGNLKVGPEEYDSPPPSKRSLGGEGDIAAGDLRSNSDFSSISTTFTPAGYENPVVYVTAVGGITPSTAHPFMQVAGSNQAITITANPRIARGVDGQILTIVGVGSPITFQNGNGLAMMGSLAFTMDSGSVLTFFYTTGGNVWLETSRNKQGGI